MIDYSQQNIPNHRVTPSPRLSLAFNNGTVHNPLTNPLFKSVRQFKKSLIDAQLVRAMVAELQDQTNQSSSSVTFSSVEEGHCSTKVTRKLAYLTNKGGIQTPYPYIQTLCELRVGGEAGNPEQTRLAKEMCYIGIGKSIVQVKEIPALPYSRVNLLIRQYMIESVSGKLAWLKKLNPQHIFVQSNDRGLGFKTTAYKECYQHIISRQQFGAVIRQSNRIVEQQYLNFKRKRRAIVRPEVGMSWWVGLIGIILMAIYLLTQTKLLGITSLGLFLLSVGMNIPNIFIQAGSIHQDRNVIALIQESLQKYLQEVNSEAGAKSGCKWRCGKDFYWLQILPSV